MRSERTTGRGLQRACMAALLLLLLASPVHSRTSVSAASPHAAVSFAPVRASSHRVPFASRTSASVTIVRGWNLLSLPIQAGITSASTLLASFTSQLGPGSVSVIAIYRTGAFRLYVPGYSVDLPVQPSQGIFVLSTQPGTWSPSGTPYANPQQVYLRTGWNLVAAPFPSQGIGAATIASQVGGCVQEIATYSGGSYQTWFPGGGALTIPSTAGMWILCNAETPWSPMPPPPPDPATVAPPVDQTVATDLATATQFLYTGNNPTQTGVALGTIDPAHVAVVRGRVIDRTGTAITGAMISILSHPELGQTESRADGRFDLAVNGGGQLIVSYQRNGYLPVQRQVQTPWQDYVSVPDVVMIPLDTQVTAVDLSSSSTAFQVAQGSSQTDASGTRQATLLFQPGTTATMTLPDGSVQPVNAGHVRATEYTVGAAGPQAMPGDLPPTSGYTYAVDLTLDEAQAVGATSVQFTKPVYTYVQNFLQFPTGSPVPEGYYDRSIGKWVPSTDGLVVKILSVTGGKADLDVDGSGTAGSAAAYATLDITDGERMQLATLYAQGTSLWRVPIMHFSSDDGNWPYGPPPGAGPFPGPAPDGGGGPDGPGGGGPGGGPGGGGPGGGCGGEGSIIGCQTQTLGEGVPVRGTAFTLHYQSERTPGRKEYYSLHIPLSQATLPPQLKSIKLEVLVAGRDFTQDFPASANQATTFVWDGKDVYGSTMQGAQRATVRIGYIYPAVYMSPCRGAGTASAQARASRFALEKGRVYASVSPLDLNFARYACSRAAASPDGIRNEMTFWKEYHLPLGSWNQRAADGLGGWSLSPHHSYDSVSHTLYLGDGTTRVTRAFDSVIKTVAGNGNNVLIGSGDGGPARLADLSFPYDVKTGPDGSFYILTESVIDFGTVRRVGPDGIIHAFAGSGARCDLSSGSCGDGGPATQAQFNYPHGLAVAPDGSVYIADTNRVRRVGTDGIITTVAGTGAVCPGGFTGPCGDGGPAAQAQFIGLHGIAVAPDGILYIADGTYIRRVGPDGRITTAAGCYRADAQCSTILPAQAAHANIGTPAKLAVGPDGSLYLLTAVSTAYTVLRIGPDGSVSRFAGDGTDCPYPYTPCGDGGPAAQAQLASPTDITAGTDGRFYISQNGSVRLVAPDGFITTVAGTGDWSLCTASNAFCGEGGPAALAQLALPQGVALEPDGSLLLAERNGHLVRRISPSLPGFSVGEVSVSSLDGSELYFFSTLGRHLRTVDARTGAVRYRFSYDNSGHVASVTDAYNNVTMIQRDVNGNPASITAPGGQTTTFTVDANGYLSSIADAMGNSYHLSSTADGLLQTLADQNGKVHTMTYDSLGRLTGDQNPAGGGTTLARTDANDGTGSYNVKLTSALGRITTYQVQFLPTGARKLVKISPDGTQITEQVGTDGSTTLTYPDGVLVTKVWGPDPRWGMLAPLIRSETIKTPAGLQYGQTKTRTVTLSDPNNLLSLTGATDTISVNGKAWTATYNAAARTVTVMTPAGRREVETLDANGQLMQDQNGGLTPSQYGYDTHGHLTTITRGSRITTLTYDAGGNLASFIDPLGRTSSFTYDLAGRITSQTGPDGTTQVGTSYDAAGNVISMTPPGRPAHSMSYSAVNLLQTYSPPTVGSSTPTQFSANLDKQLTQITRPDGSTVVTSYDGGGRLNSITIARGSTSYGYDATSGALKTITAPDGGTLSYIYDGSVPTGKAWAGTVAGSISTTYNGDFRPISASVNGSNPITYSYDADGLLKASGAETLTYDASSGQLSGSTLGSVTNTYSHSGFGELADHSAQFQSSPLFSDQYTVDALGRVTQKIETIAGVSHTYAYTYDALGRLTQVTLDGATSAQYTYDAGGNRLSSGTRSATYDNQDRLLTYGTLTYSYSLPGEMKQVTDSATSKTTSYAYDAIGNLTGATLPDGKVIGYVLDGRNRRIGKTVNGTLVQGFLYGSDLQPIAELDGSNAVVSRFVYGSTPMVPDYLIKGGVTYRIIADERGSPRLVVNTSTGQVVQEMAYDAFGKVTKDTNPGFQPFGFAGGLYDRDTGLVHFGAREYDPTAGRWTSKDPKGFAAGTTNLYAYVSNDPVNWIDPDGRDPAVNVGDLVPTKTPKLPGPTIGDYKSSLGPFSYEPNASQPNSLDDAISRNADKQQQGGPDPLCDRAHGGEPGYPDPLGPDVDKLAARALDSLLSVKPSGSDKPLGPAPWLPPRPAEPDHAIQLHDPLAPLPSSYPGLHAPNPYSGGTGVGAF